MSQEMEADTGDCEIKAPPRERILTAADDLFRRYGIRGVGVEAIAEAAETNKMTLYRHYSSKDELVAAWLQSVVATWVAEWDALDRLPASVPHKKRIDRFLEAFGDAFERCAERGCAMMNSLAELPEKDHPARAVLNDYKAESRKRMIKLFRECGVAEPAKAAEEIQLLMDGAKSCVQDLGAARSRTRFIQMAKTLLDGRMRD